VETGYTFSGFFKIERIYKQRQWTEDSNEMLLFPDLVFPDAAETEGYREATPRRPGMRLASH
jgi:hypothetical protein